jgi:anti-sigma B factor antagonist
MMPSVHGLVHVFLTPTHFNEGEPNRLIRVAGTAGRYRVPDRLVRAQPERSLGVAVSVSIAGQGGLATVTVIGDLDLAAAEIVTQAIQQEVTATGARAVHVDLSGTQFIDSSGIGILLKGRRAADRTGVAYRVTGATDMVRQILRLSGVLEHLTAEPTADSSR